MDRTKKGEAARMLTDAIVKKLAAPGRYGDLGCTGLYVEISPRGGKSWALRYMVAGVRRTMGLGGCDIVTVAKARKKATEARALAHDGIDPIDQRKEKQLAAAAAIARRKTFAECAQQYHDAHQKKWSPKE